MGGGGGGDLGRVDDRCQRRRTDAPPVRRLRDGRNIVTDGKPERLATTDVKCLEPAGDIVKPALLDDLHIHLRQFCRIELGGGTAKPRQVEPLDDCGHVGAGKDGIGRSDARQEAGKRLRFGPLVAKLADRQASETFRKPLAISAGKQSDMAHDGRRSAKCFEKLYLRRGIGDMVLTADDVRDVVIDVVDHRGHGVDDPPVLAHQHRIGQARHVIADVATNHVCPGNLGMIQKEAPVRAAAFCLELRLLRFGQLQRRTVIDRRAAG